MEKPALVKDLAEKQLPTAFIPEPSTEFVPAQIIDGTTSYLDFKHNRWSQLSNGTWQVEVSQEIQEKLGWALENKTSFEVSEFAIKMSQALDVINHNNSMRILTTEIDIAKSRSIRGIPKPVCTIENKVKDILKWDKFAEQTYESIRVMKNDVDIIANNTGINKKIIQNVKDHLFLQEHKLLSTSTQHQIQRFHANPDIALAWKRLLEGKFYELDIDLITHEYFESRIMQVFEMNHDKIHPIIESTFPWNSTLQGNK